MSQKKIRKCFLCRNTMILGGEAVYKNILLK